MPDNERKFLKKNVGSKVFWWIVFSLIILGLLFNGVLLIDPYRKIASDDLLMLGLAISSLTLVMWILHHQVIPSATTPSPTQ